MFGDTVESLLRISTSSGGYKAECFSYSDHMKLIHFFKKNGKILNTSIATMPPHIKILI